MLTFEIEITERCQRCVTGPFVLYSERGTNCFISVCYRQRDVGSKQKQRVPKQLQAYDVGQGADWHD